EPRRAGAFSRPGEHGRVRAAGLCLGGPCRLHQLHRADCASHHAALSGERLPLSDSRFGAVRCGVAAALGPCLPGGRSSRCAADRGAHVLPRRAAVPLSADETECVFMIEVLNLSYAYGKTQVLSGVNLTAADGECVAVLGNNGVGKSTLVTCVNRIRTPSE